jgi:hypothetical protein
MKRILWTLVSLCISTGVYFTIRYGLQPKSIPVMNPTDFQNLEQLGVVIYKRLRQSVRTERLVLLGSRAEVPEDPQVWQGFLKAAAADREKIVFFARDGRDVAPTTDAWETVNVDQALLDSGEFPRRVLARIKAGHLVVVHGLSTEVTHLVKGSLGREIEALVRHPVLSLSTMPFALDEKSRDDLRPHCLDTGEDPDGQRRLGCAAQRVARKFSRKALSPDKIWAVIERHGLKEYLVFLHIP